MTVIVNRLVIFDISNEEANDFCFSPRANIIYSADNTSGKSCLLKSLYYTLGFRLKTLLLGGIIRRWHLRFTIHTMNQKAIFFAIKIHFGLMELSIHFQSAIIQSGCQIFLMSKSNCPQNKIQLPKKVVASAILNLFYIDQDSSWDKTPYKNTINLAWYDSKSIPKAVFEHVLGIKSSLNIDLTEKISELGKQKN